MYRLLLISANQLRKPYPVYPLALSYLSAYLTERLPDLEISLFDRNWQGDEQLQEQLSGGYDFVGISLRNIDDVDITQQHYFVGQYQALVQLVRESSNAELIIGGAGFSIYPELLFDILQPDYAITGEGEEPLYQLLKASMAGRECPPMPGLIRSTNSTGEAAELPIPKRSYIKNPMVRFDADLAAQYWQESGMLNIQTKRGCPYQCSFCSYPTIDGRLVRNVPIPSIIGSIQQLQKVQNADYIFFTDSVFNIKPGFNRDLAKAIIDADLNIKWGAYFSPHLLGYDDLALFKESGLSHVEFGTDSFSDDVLQSYQKPFRCEDVFRAAEACHALDIYQAHFLILNGPGESMKSLQASMDNSERLPDSVIFPFLGMRIYPKTDLQRQAIDEGMIAADDPLLTPHYYQQIDLDIDWLRSKVKALRNPWILPDEDFSDAIDLLRKKRNRKGPLWEMLL